ncbi:MAG: transposase, partial [Alphaproteobacteria bacterium]|nr:transposase [Alphaproteobacteria bacterium]
MNQLEMVCLEQMVLSNHRYRRFMKVWDFKKVNSLLKQAKSNNPHEGYGIEKIFRYLLLQFLEDLSDRELEVFLQENSAGKWFCGFLLSEDTPDHTVFSRTHKKIGTNLLSKLFENLRDQLKAQGYM